MVGRGELSAAAGARMAPLSPQNGERGGQWRDQRTVINGSRGDQTFTVTPATRVLGRGGRPFDPSALRVGDTVLVAPGTLQDESSELVTMAGRVLPIDAPDGLVTLRVMTTRAAPTGPRQGRRPPPTTATVLVGPHTVICRVGHRHNRASAWGSSSMRPAISTGACARCC